MDDAVEALIMAFSVVLFVIGFSVLMYMFSQVTYISEKLVYYADKTAFYDNIKIAEIDEKNDSDLVKSLKNGSVRVVEASTIIPTLYRYADENFSIEIYDSSNNLQQVFDLSVEELVNKSIPSTKAKFNTTDTDLRNQYAYRKIYNDSSKDYYMFGVPWLGKKENIKARVDLFITGKAGYIADTYVDYTKNTYFADALSRQAKFKEQFIQYTWDGEVSTYEDDTELINSTAPKDKIIIMYTEI